MMLSRYICTGFLYTNFIVKEISTMCVNSTKGRNYVYKRNYIGKDLLNHEIGDILIG
jgi:hypothetical protein